MCYPIQMSVLSPRLPAVDHQTEGQKTFLRYKGETLDINTPHFHKLVRLTVVEGRGMFRTDAVHLVEIVTKEQL